MIPLLIFSPIRPVFSAERLLKWHREWGQLPHDAPTWPSGAQRLLHALLLLAFGHRRLLLIPWGKASINHLHPVHGDVNVDTPRPGRKEPRKPVHFLQKGGQHLSNWRISPEKLGQLREAEQNPLGCLISQHDMALSLQRWDYLQEEACMAEAHDYSVESRWPLGTWLSLRPWVHKGRPNPRTGKHSA